MRAVLDLAGVQDVLGKSLGSSNKLNTVKATVRALEALRSRDEILAGRNLRGEP
jgi:small subunit ribosomal protein S5